MRKNLKEARQKAGMSCGQYASYYCAWMDGMPKKIGCGHCLNKGTSVQPDGECKDWQERIHLSQVQGGET